MAQEADAISLGFSHQTFQPGVHICHIYGSEAEREDVLCKYLSAGIQGRERSACFSESTGSVELCAFLVEHGIDCASVQASGALSMSGVRDIYFRDGCFDPERMLAALRVFYVQTLERGYRAARVIGDMLPEVHDLPGGSRLLEYESRVTMLLRECPITSICQYDSRAFDGATVMDVLKVHPLMIVRGSVLHNPFYIPPEIYLKGCAGSM